MRYDYLIVGAGLTGSVLAERLTSAGKRVLVIDKRGHIGGNCYDRCDVAGVLVHMYGPHYFRTDREEVVEYLGRFTEWLPVRYEIKASLKGVLYPFPINRNTLNKFFGLDLKDEEMAEGFLRTLRADIKAPANAEEQLMSLIGGELTDAFYRNYTKKQWGLELKELDPSVVARVPVRPNADNGYFNERFQAMPKDGYTAVFERMLRGVEVLLATQFDELDTGVGYDRLIYTGPIDEFFHHKFGRLQYRSLEFEFVTLDRERYQDWVQINFPNEHEYTRIVEIKHVTGQSCARTTIVKEYPRASGEAYYPVPSPTNRRLLDRYRKEAQRLDNVLFAGRLGRYEYLNMDQVIKAALDLFDGLVGRGPIRS